MNSLIDFYRNEVVRNDLKKFLNDYLREVAIERVFDNKPTVGVADAKEIIDGAFDQLEILCSPKNKGQDYKNIAR